MTNSVVFVLFSSEFEHPKLGENFEPRICSYFFEEIDGKIGIKHFFDGKV
jgi:hypothetical protein